ncbi:hypothetical protein C0Q70_15656 [Pomacea canaliculata]|uniref:Coiled-coil domain-containing protein 51 n=1 Tax=Pomacea canaliculata TaxID=400727 RepID=A0A2T7NVF2_POMCA|nr:hypothetical protein C0Q70_15656 [Pomacea canaliculata]
MTLFKLVRHRIDFKHVIFFKQVRNRSITGHVPTDVALKTITGGRVDRWLQSYEDFVGLTEVKQAQTNVIQAESRFLAVQEERRQKQQAMEAVQSRVRAISAELEKTNRADPRYLDLVRNEHSIIREENDLASQIRNLEKAERESFAVLSSALRDSHEKERARAEKTNGSELQQQTEKILHALKLQEENLDSEIREIRHLLGLEKSQMLKGDDAVVYVGPEVESMMKRTEENLERKIKYSALASATFVYGALALTLPIIFSFLRGGS